MIKTYTFTGAKDGPSLLVLGAVHGNETAGPNAIQKMMAMLQEHPLAAGRLTLVPVCNERAFAQDVRQIDENLNRVICPHKTPQTYEQQLANDICALIRDHQVMIDLHSTHCPDDKPFAFCDYPQEENQRLIATFPVAYVLHGWPQIYATGGPIRDFSTEWYAHQCGRLGTTVECGYHKGAQGPQIAYQVIQQALCFLKMIPFEQAVKPCHQTHIMMKSYVVKEKEGHFCQNYHHLDKLVKGQPIARYDDGEVLYAPADGYILLPNHQGLIGAEWYYLGV